MLRAAYGDDLRRRGFVTAVFNLRDVPAEGLPRAFFRATGQRHSERAAPSSHRRSWSSYEEAQEPQDPSASWMTPKIQWVSSRIDAKVEADAALAYLEWTLELKNDSPWQAEGIGQIALPPGGVVSRATLWVGDEEQEAAFAGRGEATAAYEAVVRQRRDPLLVTTSGTDRVEIRCFPIPPRGGAMRFRLGITTPWIHAANESLLKLPRFLESNFAPEATAAANVSSAFAV